MEITASLNEGNDTVFTIDGVTRPASVTMRYMAQDLGIPPRQVDALLNAARQASPEVMAVINARIARRQGR